MAAAVEGGGCVRRVMGVDEGCPYYSCRTHHETCEGDYGGEQRESDQSERELAFKCHHCVDCCNPRPLSKELQSRMEKMWSKSSLMNTNVERQDKRGRTFIVVRKDGTFDEEDPNMPISLDLLYREHTDSVCNTNTPRFGAELRNKRGLKPLEWVMLPLKMTNVSILAKIERCEMKDCGGNVTARSNTGKEFPHGKDDEFFIADHDGGNAFTDNCGASLGPSTASLSAPMPITSGFLPVTVESRVTKTDSLDSGAPMSLSGSTTSTASPMFTPRSVIARASARLFWSLSRKGGKELVGSSGGGDTGCLDSPAQHKTDISSKFNDMLNTLKGSLKIF